MERLLTFELPTDLRCIEDAVEDVVAGCVTCDGVRARLQFNFRICLIEAIANAMIYGNGEDPSKRVKVEVEVYHERIVARVADQGAGFDPSRLPDPTAPAHLFGTSGRGIFLMRHLVDEVRFNECGNEVTLILRAAGVPRREASA